MTTNFEGVAVIALDNPPVNSLGHALRSSIAARIKSAQEDHSVRAVVLTGTGRTFCAGADVTEVGTPSQFQEPKLPVLLELLESSTKPVVAALSGAALGGGLELALACHGRVAIADARVGLPEILLGLIPGSGGTQRLPRLIGMELALSLMMSGQAREAQLLRDSGLFDAVVEDGVVAVAAALALDLAEQGAPYPRARDRNLPMAKIEACVAEQRSKFTPKQRRQPAYLALLEALSACALPFREGCKRERDLFLGLISTSEAKALRYLFRAEREAVKAPPELGGDALPVRTLCVIGAGTMGAGIAISALEAGLEVVLLEQDASASKLGQERVESHFRQRCTAGKTTEASARACLARLVSTSDWNLMADADVVIEAVFEDLGVKQAVFTKIDVHARAGAVLATNTSYLDVDAIAAATSRPQDVIGLHFFSPAQVMKLLEVVRTKRSSPSTVATGMALGRQLKKTAVLTGNAFGFIGNRIYNAYRRQCEFMLEDGAWPEEIDSALTEFGFAMGPFAVADLSGLDIAWRMRKAQAGSRDPRERYVAILDRLCELGRFGRKAKAGYYAYTDGRQATTTDDVVRALIVDASAQRGIARRPLAPQEIQRRALAAMVNEAAHVLAEGVASRASDIDVVLVQGYGFPRWEGGPVCWARQQHRGELEALTDRLAEQAGYGFSRADLALLLAN